MGPIRGNKKRKRTVVDNKKANENASSGSAAKEGPVDWWDGLSKRINGHSPYLNSSCRSDIAVRKYAVHGMAS
ncbi:hypothetical protein Tsubulata_013727 [Turnera subulata]|uniref:Uncharacterized protein n=1 Tax=Turnera subulata TaxID=218843 RepID=A0A9Q0JB81_9ROSI|nr:hypothetical protein Tsubulata_051034 [Turnera subulata]KAJ4836191.1 hypothetical protein Tsubulata_013727 [Turnera subulata]